MKKNYKLNPIVNYKDMVKVPVKKKMEVIHEDRRTIKQKKTYILKKKIMKTIKTVKTKKIEYGQLFPQYCGWLKITSSLNNLILTFTDLNGNVKYSLSSGQKTNGKKGARSNYFVMLNTITAFCDMISKKEKNPKKINVSFKGHNLIEKLFTKGLKKKSIEIGMLYNTTSIPHNGCRLKKYRRI